MFKTSLTVRIDDINYGNHLAHDKLITLMHEARLRFFDKLGQSEVDFYGTGLILKSLQVDYRGESFYGEVLQFYLSIKAIRSSAFSLFYQIINDNNKLIAEAEIVLVAFDYQHRKIQRLSPHCKEILTKYLMNQPINQGQG